MSDVVSMSHLYPKYVLGAWCPAQVQTTRVTVGGTMQSVITAHVAKSGHSGILSLVLHSGVFHWLYPLQHFGGLVLQHLQNDSCNSAGVVRMQLDLYCLMHYTVQAASHSSQYLTSYFYPVLTHRQLVCTTEPCHLVSTSVQVKEHTM
jgi:hypothetical protein